MAPTILNNLLGRSDVASLGPLAARSVLLGRDASEEQHDPESGILHPQEINNNAVFAVFGLLGAAFVIGGIWFFFWAKNGGFYFKKGDWEDYKSTVLRRKVGPNGTIYSDATPSTVLGGGSVYKDVDDGTTNAGEDLTTVVSATTGITGITGGVSDISGREKRRKKREQKEREKERRREEKAREKEERRKSRRRVNADGIIIDEEAEKEAQEQLRSYRHEKPARVGGINREADGSTWDGSTNPSWSTMSPSHADGTDTGSTVTSELMSNRERTPTTTPTKKDANERAGRIRKVYSTADKTAMRENERLRAEARRLQEKGRAATSKPKRDFSFIRGAEETMALRRIDEAPAESVVSGSYLLESNVTADDNNNNNNNEKKDDKNNNDYADREKRARSRSRRRSAPREVPGSWAESEVSSAPSESDVGTKVYTHPHHIPTGSEVSSPSSYAEEKRKKRGGAGARRNRDGSA
ncbi:hypothetical protein MYCTH_2302003 [Thermothelomyces thermophilus ATCC 42464]|uniref:Endosomal spry domain-containing protein n=1 Tax=Thermothelomyces thermophilus (strain ATCC 42464 / BCRC 31852 / DSM 1799) TaxID=573729 RepID=G2QAW0_THET4|nr:uncharacterized protein MYCTH_2302003 [Thermothelomyces thermophilus ATCC 42464]AEO56752.1 hypothetical protein MYCTH_2302003 [Thermothelomyces thermophilus ATCC 42464]